MEAIRVQVLPETKKFIDEQMDSLVQGGMKEAEAHEKVQAQLDSYLGYDAKTGQYVVTARPHEAVIRDQIANKDSLLEQTSRLEQKQHEKARLGSTKRSEKLAKFENKSV